MFEKTTLCFSGKILHACNEIIYFQSQRKKEERIFITLGAKCNDWEYHHLSRNNM